MHGAPKRAARFGRYQVLGRIGVGGMGEVFRAVPMEGHLDGVPAVALKLMRPDHAQSDHLRKMFSAEAAVGARLSHPNLVRVLDHGEVGQVLYIAFELVDGLSLDRLLCDAPLTPPLAAHVALEVLAALEYAHEQSLIHRDVSAANVIISTSGAVKLTDFGVVKVKGLSLTRTNEIKGKPAYMAPEQLRSPTAGAIDRRVDVFAVGVLLHRMLLGRGPFDDVAEWLMEGAPLDVKGPFAAVLSRALAILPDERYPTAGQLAQAVRRVLPAEARPAEELAARVRGLRKPERPLQALDQLIIAEFAEKSSAQRIPVAPLHRPRLTLVAGGIPARDTQPVRLPGIAALEAEFDDAHTVRRQFEDSQTLPRHLGLGPSAAPRALEPSQPAARRWLAGARGWLSRWRRPLAALLAGALAATVALATRWLTAPAVAPVENAAVAPVQAAAAEVPPSAVAFLKPVAVEGPAPSVAFTKPTPAIAPVDKPPAAVVSGKSGEERPRARPRPAPARGLLTLDTEPWGTVYLGARKLGTTPFARVTLPAGRHLLSLDVEDSGRRRPITVKLAAGVETRLQLHVRQGR